MACDDPMLFGYPSFRSFAMTSVKRTVVAVSCLVAVLAAGYVAGSRRVTGIPNVVIITLDTTRADRLSPYGFMSARMPNLERLAAEGVMFRQAMTVAPLTLPAHASLMTGLLPVTHGVRDNADGALDEQQMTLAEVLRTRGYATGAFVGSVVLQSDRGLAQGFDSYGDVRATDGGGLQPRRQRPGNEVVDEALEWLSQHANGAFFLWAHLYDAHAPYEAPDPYRAGDVDPYVAELLFADAQIGRLLDALDRLRLSDRTIVVVAGDHGEGLGDHGEATHGNMLYDTVLHVPLLVRAPRVRPRQVIDTVRLVDVMPTVLSLLNIEGPSSDGVSLGPALEGRPMELESYAESLYPTRLGQPAVRALREGRFKIIVGPGVELYDLDRDPFEEHNVASQRVQTVDAMRARLVRVSGLAPGTEADVKWADQISTEVRQRLAALGYVTDGTPSLKR